MGATTEGADAIEVWSGDDRITVHTNNP